jgi:hypothetical protein
MTPSTLSERIQQTNSNKGVTAITEKLDSNLTLNEEPTDNSSDPKTGNEAPDEDDWEQLADKELETQEPVKATVQPPPNPSMLELYDFDPKVPMHQLVKDFTKIVDPTGIMFFRPKMVNQSLIFTFTNPKHGT